MDQIPSLGHVPKLFKVLDTVATCSAGAALQILHQVSLSREVVETMGQCDCVVPLMKFMRTGMEGQEYVDQLGQAIETVQRMM
eukprot:gene14093-7645_t